ncbi:MAG: hypothetical protein SGJ27_31145 [Candidatus Melainabacteria bacterium]|nr:hypothetical protein [Candidatus Melainabacteria bacterium]
MLRKPLIVVVLSAAAYLVCGGSYFWALALAVLGLSLMLKPLGEAGVFITCALLETLVGTTAANRFNSFCSRWLGIGV